MIRIPSVIAVTVGSKFSGFDDVTSKLVIVAERSPHKSVMSSVKSGKLTLCPLPNPSVAEMSIVKVSLPVAKISYVHESNASDLFSRIEDYVDDNQKS